MPASRAAISFSSDVRPASCKSCHAIGPNPTLASRLGQNRPRRGGQQRSYHAGSRSTLGLGETSVCIWTWSSPFLQPLGKWL